MQEDIKTEQKISISSFIILYKYRLARCWYLVQLDWMDGVFEGIRYTRDVCTRESVHAVQWSTWNCYTKYTDKRTN